ncbi:MAG: HDOD domain-containing protein [Betaproteobacteria bacterium]
MTAKPAAELTIGRFPVTKVLGRGTQGAVYLARDPDLDRPVALKLLADIGGHGPAEGDEISPQARNLARLRHPNIIALYEAGRLHGFTYLVFEYLVGTVLREELKRTGALPLASAYSTMIQIVDAMAYAHAKGILHLDLNPSNIMRDEAGKPRILDFDLSRAVGTSPAPDRLIAGTASYMAPESFTEEGVDAGADVYALGRIFYELLTGERAAPVDSNAALSGQMVHAEIDLALLRNADPAGHFTEIIQRATRSRPSERYADAGAMHEAMLAAWKRYENSLVPGDAALYGTVAYVMKRIERRGDFPAISRTLAEVNQLTSGDQQSPISRLTNVVLRDYALTNRLLKLANSAGFSRVSGKVGTVSDAITLLGVEQVRMTCNGLTCFGHFARRKQDVRLREESIAAFNTGLLARHLAAQCKSREVEQAFLAGMLFTLGRMLTIYYFNDDFEEIESLVARGATEEAAARSVLGIGMSELGIAVGRLWGLPEPTLACMDDAATVVPPQNAPPLRAIVRLAQQLVCVDARRQPPNESLLAASAALRPHLILELPILHALLDAGIAKFKTFAPVLEVDVAQSQTIQRVDQWLREFAPNAAPGDPAAASVAA